MKWTTLTCAIALLSSGVACSESSPGQPESANQQMAAPGTAPAAAIDPGFDPDKERAVKKQWQERHAQQTQIADIDWDAVEQADAVDVDLGAAQRETLQRAQVPVLLPADQRLIDSATFTSRNDWYAAGMEGDGVSVYVSGTRREFVHPSIDARQIDASEPRVTRNELIMTLSFKRWGAAYTVEVECARPSEDARCQNEDYIREVGRSMGLVGGLQ